VEQVEDGGLLCGSQRDWFDLELQSFPERMPVTVMDGLEYRRLPILVTGVPRSGTTWFARLLAAGAGMALTGREPMNPRGRQYALAHTLSGWARLRNMSARQRRAVRLAYLGLNPWTYSRYGHRQWAAPLPWTTNVIKDPFALLSIPGILDATGGIRAVLIYRHPGAVLASYRRMGWEPDIDEVQRLITAARDCGGPNLDDLPHREDMSYAEAMGRFWSTLHEFVLHDLLVAEISAVTHVIAHSEVASGGPTAGQAVASALGITWNSAMSQELSKESSANGSASSLHNLDRAPSDVAEAWRGKVSNDEIAEIDAVTAVTMAKLARARLRLAGGVSD